MTFREMVSYTTQQRVQIFDENWRSMKSVFRKLDQFYGSHNLESTIGRIIEKCQVSKIKMHSFGSERAEGLYVNRIEGIQGVLSLSGRGENYY